MTEKRFSDDEIITGDFVIFEETLVLDFMKGLRGRLSAPIFFKGDIDD